MTTPRPPIDGTDVPEPVTDTDPRIPAVIEPTGMPAAEEYEDTMPGEEPTDPEIKKIPVARLEFARGDTRQRRSRKYRRARREVVRVYGSAEFKLACAVWRPFSPLVIGPVF